MKLQQPMGSASASGSAGGITVARNRYGFYQKAKTTPVNPRTSLQSAVRSTFAQLCAAWSSLTAAQRAAWEEYSNATPRNDVFGNSQVVGGRAVFIGNNSIRVQSGLAVISAGPVILTMPGLTAPVLTVTAGDPVSVAFTAGDEWTMPTGGGLSLFLVGPKSPTTNYCKGPYRFAGKIASGSTSPASPQTIASPFVYAAGQKVFYRMVAMTADGRISSPSYGSVFCGA
jgi:hypothetical protein